MKEAADSSDKEKNSELPGGNTITEEEPEMKGAADSSEKGDNRRGRARNRARREGTIVRRGLGLRH